jgi:hypothetical protein
MSYEALVEDRSRNLRLLEVHPSLVLDLFKVNDDRCVTIQGRKLECVSDAIPPGAEVSSCGINERGNILLHVSHESFSPTSPGSLVPRISPVFRLGEGPEVKQ